jgi:hypothetical protein
MTEWYRQVGRAAQTHSFLRGLFFTEGEVAFGDGADVDSNPYAPDGLGHAAWNRGWFAAFREAKGKAASGA